MLKAVDDIEQRFLMETRPGVSCKTPHYDGYEAILIRLSHVDEDDLRGLLEQFWRRLATKTLLRAGDA